MWQTTLTESDRFRLWADHLIAAGFQVGGGDLTAITMHSCTAEQIKNIVACLKRQKTKDNRLHGNYLTITDIHEEILCHLMLSSPKPKTFFGSLLAMRSRILMGGIRLLASIQNSISKSSRPIIGMASRLFSSPSSNEPGRPG